MASNDIWRWWVERKKGIKTNSVFHFQVTERMLMSLSDAGGLWGWGSNAYVFEGWAVSAEKEEWSRGIP